MDTVEKFLADKAKRIVAIGLPVPEPPESTSTFEEPKLSDDGLWVREVLIFLLEHSTIERGYEAQARAIRRRLQPKELRTNVNASVPL